MASYDRKMTETATSQWVMKEVGFRLAKIRLSRNITQNYLAQSAGIGLRTLRRIERGESSTFDSFLRVVIVLGYTDGLLSIFPVHDISPIDRMKLKRKERKRARPNEEKLADTTWTWKE